MNLYLISQEVNNGYATYDSAVVCAESGEAAQLIHPDSGKEGENWWEEDQTYSTWTVPAYVSVELIGQADSKLTAGEVICASFNAG